MKVKLMAVVAAASMMGAGAAMAQEALAKSDGCLNCHDVSTKKVGPAFKDVAAKYKGKADAQAMLVAKVSEGKGHPATKAKPEDVQSIIKWVLSQ